MANQRVAKLMYSNITVTSLHIRQYGFLPPTDYDTLFTTGCTYTPGLCMSIVGVRNMMCFRDYSHKYSHYHLN